MNKRWLLALILFTVAACAPKDQTPQTEAIEAPDNNNDVLFTPDCILGFETYPSAISPIGGVIVDPSPPHVFTWDLDCIPMDYMIRLYKSDDLTTYIEKFYDIEPTDKQYTSQVQLDPLTSYTWKLQVYVGKAPKSYASGDFQTGKLKINYIPFEFKALLTANCRKDPWAGENYVSVLWEGETAELLGLNEDATWGMFKLQNELECWVMMELVEPVPPDALYFPQSYPEVEHGEPPDDIPVPASDDEPSDGEPSDGETPIGCMVPTGRSGTLTCQIPCPDPKYAARVCP